MKKSTFFILLIGITLLLCSCGKDYDYRDKWVGEYQCKVTTDYYAETYYCQEGEKTLYVTKDGNEGISISDGGDYPTIITATIQKDGFLNSAWPISFSGSFIGHDSLTFTYTLSGSGRGWVWDTYFCKKDKK